MRAAIPFQPGMEKQSSDEVETQKGLVSVVTKIEEMTHKVRARASRGVHAKSIGLLRGTLRVHDNLPKELAQGLFAEPASYEAIVRMSTIPGDVLSDAVSVPRGFALKVLNVPGTLLTDARGIAAQDFLFASGKSFSAPTPNRFLHILRLLASTTERLSWLKVAMSRIMRAIQRVMTHYGHPVESLGILGGYPPTNPLGENFYTQAPIRFGSYVAKLGVFPESAHFKALAGIEVPVDHHPDALRDAIRSVLSQGGGSWTLRAQLRRDAEANPIEDASVVWPEEGNPYIAIATLSVAAQDGWNETLSENIDEGMSFSPWHGLSAHLPLGAVMRARRFVYPKAVALRSALNHRKKRKAAAVATTEAPASTAKISTGVAKRGASTRKPRSTRQPTRIKTFEAVAPSAPTKRPGEKPVRPSSSTTRTPRAKPTEPADTLGATTKTSRRAPIDKKPGKSSIKNAGSKKQVTAKKSGQSASKKASSSSK